MFGKDSIMWKKYFGLAWEETAQMAPNIGRYALFKDSNSYELDDNARKLLGFEGTPSFENVANLIKRLDNDAHAHILVKQLHDDSATTLGYVYEQAEHISNDTLSLCTLNLLISSMAQAQSRSLLTLIQLEESTGRHVLSDMQIYEVLTVIMENVPKEALICNIGQGKIWLYVPDFSGDDVEYLTGIKNKVEEASITSLGSDDAGVTFTAGCAASLSSPVQRMNTAKFTLFEAEAMGFGTILAYSVERYEDQKNEFARIEQFATLLDSNMFRYHFQPIISARTGEIIAYELLMRSGGGIEMFPLEILDHAAKYDRLYDIEKATFFNALHIVSENQQQFSAKKLFINSIASHMLSKDDWDKLLAEYGELLEKVVIEITEQTEMTDETLNTLENRIAYSNMELAIDDYGAGYSNTTNLMRYNPSYVKIDRQLIAGIDSSLKMQRFVSSLVEALHVSGYQALAEGVETKGELTTVIGLGVDLIQGFYISKPKPFILYEIADSIRDEIIKINLEFSENIDKIYHPKNHETVELKRLSEEHYTVIFVETQEVIVEGDGKTPYNMSIIVKDGLECKITLRGAIFTVDKDNPIISLGADSKVTINIEGKNELNSKGILVPASADLMLIGDGALSIKSELTSAYAIGCDKHSSIGNITILIDGHLAVEANGDNSVGIGGGMNNEDKVIKILSGNVVVNCSGGSCVGIGIHEGKSNIVLNDCAVTTEISSASCIGIGSLKGDVDIKLENIAVTTNLTGMNLCGVGSGSGGKGNINFVNGRMDCTLRGKSISCLGTHHGDIDISVSHTAINFYCEGGDISGIGDMYGDGDVRITDSEIILEFHTGNGFGLGSKTGRLDVINCRDEIRINE